MKGTSMAEKTFYDEMVECLRLTRRNTPAVTVSEAVMKDFMTDMPRRKKAESRPAAPPTGPVAVQVPAEAPVQTSGVPI